MYSLLPLIQPFTIVTVPYKSYNSLPFLRYSLSSRLLIIAVVPRLNHCPFLSHRPETVLQDTGCSRSHCLGKNDPELKSCDLLKFLAGVKS